MFRSITFMKSPRSLARVSPVQLQIASKPVLQCRFYSRPRRTQETPKVRYLFYVFLASTVLLYYAGNTVDKKQPKKSFSEREFDEYERTSGIKRRHKLLASESNEQYKFYVVPYVNNEDFMKKLAEKLGSKQVKIIDPDQLVENEIKDESRRYSFLLQDLQASKKPYPKGLITALIRQEIQFQLNTRSGTFDTNFVIKNYPQTPDEAIKFENDVSDIEKCIVLHYDILNLLPKAKPRHEVNSINNVVGYFETAGKAVTVAPKHDVMDDALQEIVLKDI